MRTRVGEMRGYLIYVLCFCSIGDNCLRHDDLGRKRERRDITYRRSKWLIELDDETCGFSVKQLINVCVDVGCCYHNDAFLDV